MQNVLVTGGTGSLGSRLVPAFARLGWHVTVLSRNAHRQAEMMESLALGGLAGRVRFILGDICDPVAVGYAVQGQEVVVHAAAQKRLERGESDTHEYIRINVRGTENLAAECVRAGVGRCLFISTDKAVEASTFYGCTKAVAEKYWVSKSSGRCCFAALRYGNVVESNGSVWHYWKRQMAAGLGLSVREPEPTRFMLSLHEAVVLVIAALKEIKGGEVFIPRSLPAFSVWELARVLQPEENWRMQKLVPGEKQHEVLLALNEQAVMVNRLLARVGVADMTPEMRGEFCSGTAHRLSGLEVARRLEGGDHSGVGVKLVAPGAGASATISTG